MVIELCSGINADYLIIDGKRYNYGYDISKYPNCVRYGRTLPTIEELIEKADNVVVKAGLNKFTGKPVSDEDVEAFCNKYAVKKGE